MTLDGNPRTFATKPGFVLHIDDFTDAPVTTVSALGGTLGKVVVRGGGGFYHVQVGERDPKDLTVERPCDLANAELYNWWQDCLARTAGHVKQLSVDILNPDGSVAYVWNIENAVVTDYEGFSGDANAVAESAMEKVTIANTRQYISAA